MTSFLAVNAQRYIDPVETNQVNRLAELLLLSNAEEPLIVLQFNNFDLLGQFDAEHAQTYPFLATLFEASLEPVLQEDDVKYLSNGFDHAHVVTVGEIPASASDLLRGEFTTSENAVVVQFTEESYDVAELDDFLETMYAFMEDSMNNVDNIVLRMPSSDSANAESLINAETSKDVGVDDPEVDDPEDSDALSSLWTEGLLSCLIVSGLLLAILVTALSWLGSLDISYGALEKTTNPLKKNN
ncbi:unnamed protein product [Kluyveromyces dobzhanskii CBS 2104]|uniref:WGS project CCBQ000000000 data, contig 00102 n=1 Tax=Kluyveromyces dobzhanskii CBS 2104 TaxID=1427455 RepID=A0A0A8L6R0_9SACH|nr:unnamed protein product [Kluyveromyces dobzhanskii CBS 2104]